MHYANATQMAAMLRDKKNTLLSTQGSLHVDARTNQLIVQDTEAKLRIIDQIVRQTDIPVQQIMIETRLASVDDDFERELGIHFSSRPPTPTHMRADRRHPEPDTLPAPAGYALAVAHLADGSLLDIQLAAAETKGHAELISSPKLFAASQQAASIEAGEEIPYQEISASGATGVAFRKAVLSLHVTPQILPGRKVLLMITLHEDKPASRIVQVCPPSPPANSAPAYWRRMGRRWFWVAFWKPARATSAPASRSCGIFLCLAICLNSKRFRKTVGNY